MCIRLVLANMGLLCCNHDELVRHYRVRKPNLSYLHRNHPNKFKINQQKKLNVLWHRFVAKLVFEIFRMSVFASILLYGWAMHWIECNSILLFQAQTGKLDVCAYFEYSIKKIYMLLVTARWRWSEKWDKFKQLQSIRTVRNLRIQSLFTLMDGIQNAC